MSVPARTGVLLLSLLACSCVAAADAAAARSLRDYIAELNESGLHVIYSSDLVPDDYLLPDEPDAGNPRSALEAALAPYGLALAEGPGGSLLITRAAVVTGGDLQLTISGDTLDLPIAGAAVQVDGTPAGVTDAAGRLVVHGLARGTHRLEIRHDDYRNRGQQVVVGRDTAQLALTLKPLELPLAEIVVTSSRYNLRYDVAGSHTFIERDLTTKLPDIGDEAVRGIARLPGTTSGGVSTRTHVRGGVQNEQLFLLDGLRLYEPYHMKDFHSVATIVDQNAISGIDFYSAGYQARYGDRMSGVVDIALRDPPEGLHTELGLSFFNTSALSMGRFGGDRRGDWMASVRRGNLDLITAIVNPDLGTPRYEDSLLHVGWQLSPQTALSANLLYSYDKIAVAVGDGSERGSANYRNGILWLKAETDWNDRWSGTTVFSATDIDTSRRGSKDIPGMISGEVNDNRNFQSVALKHDWFFDAADTWTLRGGFDAKHLDAHYEYESLLQIDAPFDSILDNQPLTERTFALIPTGAQYAVYAEWRWRPWTRLVLDVGARWDAQTYTTAANDDQVSPRLNLLYKLGPKTDLRLAFGHYFQAQEINELQVSDGLDEFFPAQRAEHLVAGLSHTFDSGIDLRLEWYQKRYHSLMPRFENVFDSLVLIPELQIDRVRIDADTAIAQGAELVVSGDRGNFLWWASYVWSESRDNFATGSVRRSWDQAHTVKAGVNWDYKAWSFSAAGVVHTGWPKTALVATDEVDGVVLAAVPRNSLRYSVFHSLDARVSRDFDVRRGTLTAFLEVNNLYNRGNPCCTDYRMASEPSGGETLRPRGRNWLPLVPSLGVLWSF